MSFGVERILKASDFYTMLGVERNADDVALKKAYRKLATQVHPDKCKDPKATEAFQKVSHAFKILINPNKRSEYDLSLNNPEKKSNNWYSDNMDYEVYEMPLDELLKFIFASDFHQWDDTYPKQRQKPKPKPIFKCWKMVIFVFIFVFIIFPLISSIAIENYNSKSIYLDLLNRECIKFENPTSNYKYMGQTPKYRQKYYIDKAWLRLQENRETDSFKWNLGKAADEYFKKVTLEKCKIEKELGLRVAPHCAIAKNKKML